MYGCFDVPGLTNCPDGESCQMLEPPTPSNPKPLRLVPLESILNCNFNSGIKIYFFLLLLCLRTCKKGEQIPNPPTPWYYCTVSTDCPLGYSCVRSPGER